MSEKRKILEWDDKPKTNKQTNNKQQVLFIMRTPNIFSENVLKDR